MLGEKEKERERERAKERGKMKETQRETTPPPSMMALVSQVWRTWLCWVKKA